MFAVATLCPAQDVKPTDLGNGTAFNGKKIEMKDKGEVAYLLSFTSVFFRPSVVASNSLPAVKDRR